MSNTLPREKYSLLFFDLDGTLADTIDSIKDAVNMALERYGFPPRTYEDIRLAIGNGARKLISRSVPPSVADDSELVAEVYALYEESYEKTFMRADRCYDGMYETVISLRERGYTLAVLSNKQDAFVKKIVEILFPEGTFAEVMGQTELPTKPDPTVPLMIAERLGVAPAECAFIGDSDVDIKTGLASGMAAIGCSWGYRSADALRAAGADAVIDDPRELLKLFG